MCANGDAHFIRMVPIVVSIFSIVNAPLMLPCARLFHWLQVDVDALPTQRLRLVALPFSKDTVFGPSDISELVMLLSEAPGQSCRLPKLRSMFAMRACRSAIMIGTALEPSKMRQLVLQLAQLDQPWNCPHGRPTIRHLCDMEALSQTGAARAFGAAL